MWLDGFKSFLLERPGDYFSLALNNGLDTVVT